MPRAPKLVLPVEKEKAQLLPSHIVISSVMVNPEMKQDELHKICESLVDALFHCIVNHSQPGLYLPLNLVSKSHKKEENKSDHESQTSTSADQSDEQENDDSDDDDEKDENKKDEKTENLVKQSGGKEAIIKAMIDGLDEDFFPFLMHAWEVCEERSRQEQQGQNGNNDDNNEEGPKRFVVKNPNLGCMISKRGEVLTIGSLEGCGFGVAGVFCNGV